MKHTPSSSARAVLFLIVSAAPALAQGREPRHQPDCSGGSNVEITRCTSRAYETADGELNRVFQAVLAESRRSQDVPPAERPRWEQTLRDAQRAWIAYRDADCCGLIRHEWQGGSGASAAKSGCLYDRTVERTNELTARYNVP
jgi:uncharacterized protein YecT (DUF1311 family)